MISYPQYKGRLFKMAEPYPIYDREDDDKIIGYTNVGDMAVVTYANEREDYYETIIVSGKYIGVDTLVLNSEDLKKATYIFNTIDYCGSYVSVQGKEVKYEYPTEQEERE